MSLAGILIASRDVVRKELNILNQECECRVGPEPPAWSGKVFFSVWPSDWGPGPNQSEMYDSLDELLGFSITLSYRVAYSPDDRQAEEIFLRALTGMEPYLRKVNQAITQRRYDILEQANKLVDADYGMIEPPVWLSTEAQPNFVGPEWFAADPSSDDQGLGMHMTSKFGNIRRYQPADKIQ